MEYYVRSDELQHHGIKGMKWGIRRYQNKDGSLTKAGVKRYYNKDGSLTKKGEKWYNKETSELKSEKKELQGKLRIQKKNEKLKNLKDETEEMKKSVEEQETPEAKREQLLKSTDAKELYENRNLLTTAELNERINRIDTEARLNSKIVVEHEKTGREIVNEKLKKASETINNVTNLYRNIDNAYSSVSGSSIGKALKKQLGIEDKVKEFDLDKQLKNMNKLTNQQVGELSKRLLNEKTARKTANELKAMADAEKKSKESKKKAEQKLKDAQKQVDDYNRKLYEESQNRTQDSTYRMKGQDVTEGRTRVSNPKPSENTPRLEYVERFETTGKDIVGEGRSRFNGFKQPPTQDMVYDGQKYVESLLMIEDKKRYQ